MDSGGAARQAVTRLVVVLLSVALIGVACSRKEHIEVPPGPGLDRGTLVTTDLEPDGGQKYGGKLVVAVPAESNGWNPNINQWADAGSLVGSSFLEPLGIVGAQGAVTPWLAEHWEVDQSAKVWKITLRQGVYFHDGELLNAEVLKRNLEHYVNEGAQKIANIETNIAKVTVIGPFTVQVDLFRPSAQYVSYFATQQMMSTAMLTSETRGTTNPIGTGPFIFDRWEQDKMVTVKRNPNYWRKGLPYLDSIEFRPVVDSAERTGLLRSSSVDMMLTLSSSAASDLESAEDPSSQFTVLRDYTSERTLVMLNTLEGEKNAPNPFTNVHARRALAYATNRQALLDLMGGPVQSTTQAYRADSEWALPPGQDGYYPFEPIKARNEIELYKRETGRPKLTMTFLGLASVEDAALLQELQHQWESVGIEVRLETTTQKNGILQIVLGLYQAGWFRWYGATNPDSNYVYFSSASVKPIGAASANFTHYASATMDENLRTIRENVDFQVRKKANDAVVREINEQALNIWLFDTPYALVAHSKVKGLNSFRLHPFGNTSPKPWWGEVWLS